MASKLFLLAVALCTTVNADILSANDAQTCQELCNSCQGTASFSDGRCECYVSDDNAQGGDCMMRISRQAEELGLDLVDCAPENGDRPARCSLLGSARKLGTNDADRIANYFMNGGPITGTPLASSACEPDKLTGSPNPQSMPMKIEPAAKPTPTEPISAAPNPVSDCLGAPITQPQSPPSLGAHYRAPETFLGAPAPHYPIQSPYGYLHTLLSAALHPHTLGLPHVWAPQQPLSSIVGAHSPLISLITPHSTVGMPHTEIPKANIVGAPHKPTAPAYTPPKQIMKERPAQMVSSPGPILQPGYSLPRTLGAPQPEDVLSLLQQVLAHQNALLEMLSRQLQGYVSNVGAKAPEVGLPRVYYPPKEANVGAPTQTENGDYSGNEKPQAPVLSSPLKKSDCSDGGKPRSPRMSVDAEAAVEEKIVEKEIPKAVEVAEMITERPKREPRPDANGRKRKRDMKRMMLPKIETTTETKPEIKVETKETKMETNP